MWQNTEGENKMMKESRDHNFPPMHIRQASSFFKKKTKSEAIIIKKLWLILTFSLTQLKKLFKLEMYKNIQERALILRICIGID